MSCGVGHTRSSDSAWLCLWHRPATVALTGPLALEPPYAMSAALKSGKKKKKKDKFIKKGNKYYLYYSILLNQMR